MDNKLLQGSPIMRLEAEGLKKNCMNEEGVSPEMAYRIVKDQLLPEGKGLSH